MDKIQKAGRRINSKIKTFFGIADAGFSFMTFVETSYFTPFLTNYALLPNALVVLITTITGIADIVSSLVAGVFLDKSNLKWGKYRSWLLVGPPFVVLFYIFQFTNIGSPTLAAIIISLGFIISHTVWNVSWTANMSLVSVLTDDPRERAFLSSRRAAGSTVGKVVASYLTMPVVLFFTGIFGEGSSLGFTVTAGIFAAVMMVAYYMHFAISKGYEEPISASSTKTQVKKGPSLADMFKSVFSNKNLVLFVISDFTKLIGYYLLMAASFYYFNYVTNSMALQPVFLLVFNIAGFIGAIASPSIVGKIGTKLTYLLGMGGYAASIILAYFVAQNVIAVITIMGIGQVFFGFSYGLTSSFYSNGATYSQWKTGKDTKGVIMAFSGFSIKVSILVRGLILTAGIAALGFDAKAENISPEIIEGFKNIFFIAPFIFAVVAFAIMFFYNLPDNKVREMEAEIATRK
ncbi:MFS transporter [Alkalibaculum bacchi]|jgi:GPH family glycoside/pentoside/hexuronide:cation symporter|uniref:MFS transporter n=1 Tax=Alkalibaculum bacchi TaxID=645887 RepID=UPI0026F37C9E|nr:MFS transporter [Alkalibaculum bacchi]